MQNESNNSPFFEDLEEPIREAVARVCSRDVPQDRMIVCLDRVLSLAPVEVQADRDRAECSKPRALVPRTRNRRRWIFGTATVAGLTLMLLFYFGSTSVSLADVAQAVRQKPWIHLTLRIENGAMKAYQEEAWYSPTRNVTATRRLEWARFSDHKLKVYYTYDPAEGVLYRVPETAESRQSPLSDVVEALPQLLADGDVQDDPLSKLTFLGHHRENLKVVKQETQKIKDGGREWLDYSLTLKIQGQEHPIRILFRVDPDSKLPQFGRVTVQREDQVFSVEAAFDYPESGPEEIHALGVPRDAKLVDRVPTDDVARLISGLAAGRVRFDDFRAVVVDSHSDPALWWRSHSLEVIHRKGNRIRRDMGFVSGDAVEPSGNVDRIVWWSNRAREAQYRLSSIVNGGVEHTFTDRMIAEPDGSERHEIISRRPTQLGLDPEQWIPSFYTLTPDYAGRPPLGLPNPHMEATVESDPGDGPDGTVLLRIQYTGQGTPSSNPNAGKRRVPPGGWKSWIDPAREYLVMRSDIGGSSHIVESVAQSPRGHWYPTRMRWTSSDPGISEKFLDFYVEFDVEIPVALFDVKKPMSVEELFDKSP